MSDLTITAPAPSPAVAAFLAGPSKGLLVDGAWIAPVTGETFATCDPATGAELAQVARGTAPDVDGAVNAARTALETTWRATTPMERSILLWRLADLIDAHSDELAELETLDQGKAWRTSRFGEIPSAAAQFRYYSGWATKILGTTVPTSLTRQGPEKKIFAYTTREPVGVVGAIVPWNSPMLMASMKLAPALAAGCTVVLKPAENTPLTALRLGELILEAGFPPGVVNIVTGFGHEAGAAISEHPGIDKITFTGSTRVGKELLTAARGNLKRLTLELGGKSPAIVMPDADLELTIPGVAAGIFDNAGQVCVAGSRVYAHRDIYHRLLEGLAARASALRLGHGLDPETDLGPLVSRAQADSVAGFIAEGAASGAEIVAGGRQSGDQQTFIAPTVITGVHQDMRLMQEEIFGPVVAVTPFDDVDDVIAWANQTRYGLAASVWTEGLGNAHRLAAEIKAGTVWVNCHSYFGPDLPKGGHKESGWGYENGAAGLENYLETKTVCAVV